MKKDIIWCNQKSVEMLKENRASIWHAAIISFIMMFFCYLTMCYLWFISYLFTGLLAMGFVLLFFISYVGLVLKRDLFSVLIYLKEHEKQDDRVFEER